MVLLWVIVKTVSEAYALALVLNVRAVNKAYASLLLL